MSPELPIGILSDSHSQLQRLRNLAGLMKSRGVETLIHCGDITAPAAVESLRNFDVHWVFGNCDWDRGPLERSMRRCGHHCHGIRGEVSLGGKILAFTHGDRLSLLQSMILDPEIDLVIHGHTHEKRDVILDGGRVLCPGALIRVATPTAVILKIPSMEAEFVEIGDESPGESSGHGSPA